MVKLTSCLAPPNGVRGWYALLHTMKIGMLVICWSSMSFSLQDGFQGSQELTALKQALQQPVPEPLLFRYQFREPLIEGVILQKRKRFTVDVAVNGELIVCHCPTTCLSLYQTLLDGQQVIYSDCI